MPVRLLISAGGGFGGFVVYKEIPQCVDWVVADTVLLEMKCLGCGAEGKKLQNQFFVGPVVILLVFYNQLHI